MSTDIWLAILSSAVFASLINQIFETLRQKQRRKEALEDKNSDQNNALRTGVRLLLLDKVRWLGAKAIEQKEIKYEDRKMLNEMHDCYHNGLGGNGDAKLVMDSVNELPLKP